MTDSVRLSIGTAIAMGLEHGPCPQPFTTLFLMTNSPTGCRGHCSFCPQSGRSQTTSKLSRIDWPLYRLDDVLARLPHVKGIQRICLQCLNYEGMTDDAVEILSVVRDKTSAALSVCSPPIPDEDMLRLRDVGVQRMGIAIDACTPQLFDSVKGKAVGGPYTWEGHMRAISSAQNIFGAGNVTTHLIVGLGETEQEAAEFILHMRDKGVSVGLFAFTGVPGTILSGKSQPDLGVYRRIQALRYLVSRGYVTRDHVSFDERGRLRICLDRERLREILSSGDAFRVSGCPGCNRPYYNERPAGVMYNYYRPLTQHEIAQALSDTEMF
ncbi:MAG: radical SAM protein [Candidatus Thorarchaeota archaeon]